MNTVTQLHATTANVSSLGPSRSSTTTFCTPFLSTHRSQRQSFLPHRVRSLLLTQKWRQHVFLATRPLVKDGNLSINGKEAFKGVPDNIVVTPLTDTSAFIGATASDSSSRHVFKLGLIKDARLLCLFRYKMWWMIPRWGSSGSEVPFETQMLLLEGKEGPVLDKSDNSTDYYILFLPVLDGKFRSSLQGNSSDELELCVESGDPAIVTSQSLKAIFVNYGNHPFDLVKDSMMILEKQLGTFALREAKQASWLTVSM
ncbi:Raffinose synthase [Corchorus capsularis]|uniref:Raffinose synthase n=1 Tax=Corchorus capsularis TaxID=210143 RepID=A0A1R3I3C3_COCAP|nr:Raffinose synthase [Corchorus capsularis]